MTLHGIDVSRWQGVIDWPAAKRRLDFAFIKSTGGDVGCYVDAQYPRNIHNARTLKLRRGTYHFAGGTDPVKEAQFYVAHTGREDGELQVLDFEGDVLHLPNPVGWAHAWLREVYRLTKNKPLIYVSDSVTNRFDWSPVVADGFQVWDAAWGPVAPRPAHWHGWRVWQTADDGSWPGISGNVDLDVFFGSGRDWAKAGATEKPAKPKPVHPVHRPVHHPAPKPRPRRVYVVRDGDSFYKIAKKFRVSLLRLIHANPQTKNPARIFPGDRIYIP